MQKLIELYKEWSGAEPRQVEKLTAGGSNREYYRMTSAKGETVVGQDIVPREITAASVLWMPFTYFLSLFLYQAYPDEIVIPVDPSMAPMTGDAWGAKSAPVPSAASQTTNTTGGSVWDKPIY